MILRTGKEDRTFPPHQSSLHRKKNNAEGCRSNVRKEKEIQRGEDNSLPGKRSTQLEGPPDLVMSRPLFAAEGKKSKKRQAQKSGNQNDYLT